MTSYSPPSSGYSFLKVSRQCGEIVIIFLTPFPLNKLIFDSASFVKSASSPSFRMLSPQHFSSAVKTPKLTPACLQEFYNTFGNLLSTRYNNRSYSRHKADTLYPQKKPVYSSLPAIQHVYPDRPAKDYRWREYYSLQASNSLVQSLPQPWCCA